MNIHFKVILYHHVNIFKAGVFSYIPPLLLPLHLSSSYCLGRKAKSITAHQLPCSVLSMSFFDKLHENNIVRDSGRIVQCFDEYCDDFTISDELRKVNYIWFNRMHYYPRLSSERFLRRYGVKRHLQFMISTVLPRYSTQTRSEITGVDCKCTASNLECGIQECYTHVRIVWHTKLLQKVSLFCCFV